MDLREKKTRRNITNAFIELRSKKALERITVKELAELAEISKATFYLHYKDIYDLSEQLQNDVIKNVFGSIVHPEYCLTDSKQFTSELFYAFYAQQNLIEILFSDTQNAILPLRVEHELLNFIKRQYPDIDIKTKMMLTYTINGSYYVYQKYHKTYSAKDIVDFVSDMSDQIFHLNDLCQAAPTPDKP